MPSSPRARRAVVIEDDPDIRDLLVHVLKGQHRLGEGQLHRRWPRSE
ncbi:hypothetical protein [Arthrobacter sp. M4]|nr:hypothetical protein [Arthrobacter sp. M4]MCA4132475.1 hypothetical protein [Arthrobacter sp. M4]